MKTNILLTSSFLWLTGFVYSNTYVWEEYDDFSSGTLDASKWGTMYLGGGIEPHVTDGKLVLSGGVGNPNASKVVKTGWTEIFKGDDGGQAWLYAKDTEVYGIEAEFIIPNAASSMSGLQLGIASLNPLSYAIVELNAEPNSASQYSQGFGFYHLLNGSETEKFGSTQRDITHKLGATLMDGRLKLFVDGEVKYEADSETFNTDMFFLNGFNDYQAQGLAFELNADNVRVLRQTTTTSLDGSIFSLSSTDGVSETMSFENGTFTSSFVDSQKSTTITSNQSYILDSMSSNSWKITLNDGDVYSFDSSAGTGTLTDYENGVMDTSGSFNFTYIRNTWMDYDDFSDNSLDTSKWTATSSYFVGNQPTEANGRIELSGLTSQYSNTYLLFQDSEGIDGVEADIWLPSDAPVDTGVLIGIADAGTPVGYLDLWADSAQTHFYISLDNSFTGESVDFTRNAELGKMYKVAIIKGEQKTALYLDGEKVAEVSTWQSNYLDIIFRGVNNAGSSFTAYLDNVRVLRNWEDYDDFNSGTLDASKWDLWWGAGGALPTVVNDALQLSGSGNTNDPASSIIPNDLSYIAAERLPDMHSMALINQDDIYGIQAEFMIPSGPSDDTGLNLIFFDWAEDGSSKQEYGPELEYRSENGLRLEFAYTDPTSAESMQITRTAAFDTYYKMSLIHTETTSSMYSNGELIKEFSSVGFNPDTLGFAAFNDDGLPYTTYIKNVRVLRRSTTTTQPDPVTVVSDPNGQAVVVQAGSEYQWNSTLDGVTVWMVHEDDDDGWFGATIQYVSSMQQGSIGLTDQVGSNLVVNHPYVIDENGMIKVTEDTAFQYYQVTAVENGVIITADGSSFPLSDTSRFFTTRAAAEEYYYSKVPVTVISDPNGQAVVVQVGNEYQWKSTLDGVTLWSVDQSQSSGDIQPITMRFENGRNFGSEGFFDSISQPQPYDMPFVIDENGYIKVSEDNGYQYYHVVSVENGIIATLEGDEQGVVDDGVNVADQWFFTTRAAAEEYYYSKVNPKDWMWFDHYPWVYSNEMQEWLYFYPSGSKLLYYSNQNQVWREFSQ
jgi:hypothetical protein